GLVDDEEFHRSPDEERYTLDHRAGRDEINRDKRERKRCAARDHGGDACDDAEQDRGWCARQPIGDPQNNALADRDDGHAGYGRADGRWHDARETVPAYGEDALAELVELGGKTRAIAIDE